MERKGTDMDEQLTRADLEAALDAWCADMIRKGWTIDSRSGYTAAVKKSIRGRQLAQGMAITVAAWFGAALTYGTAGLELVTLGLILLGPAYTMYAVLTGVARRTATVYSDGIVRGT